MASGMGRMGIANRSAIGACTLSRMSDQTSDETTVRALRTRLERGEATAAQAVTTLAAWAVEAPTRATRLDACRLLGELAGRALGAEWEGAERAAVWRP